MKRYTIRADSGVSSTGANIFDSSTGYWVSYADHEAALAAAVKERDVLRALLLDCEMIETSDGVVHLRSNIKDALAAIRARGDK